MSVLRLTLPHRPPAVIPAGRAPDGSAFRLFLASAFVLGPMRRLIGEGAAESAPAPVLDLARRDGGCDPLGHH